MVTRHLANSGQLHLGETPEGDLLLELWTGGHIPATGAAMHEKMRSEGLIEMVAEGVSQDETHLRYSRNPFEHVTKVIFEFTTFCNFNCEHCYNSRVPRQTEANPDVLAGAAQAFLRMGIQHFAFIGGEVARYGNGWLDLVGRIHSLEKSVNISLFTNGWWLDQVDFLAAGVTYPGSLA